MRCCCCRTINEKQLTCDPGSELRKGRELKQGENIKRYGNNKIKQTTDRQPTNRRTGGGTTVVERKWWDNRNRTEIIPHFTTYYVEAPCQHLLPRIRYRVFRTHFMGLRCFRTTGKLFPFHNASGMSVLCMRVLLCIRYRVYLVHSVQPFLQMLAFSYHFSNYSLVVSQT